MNERYDRRQLVGKRLGSCIGLLVFFVSSFICCGQRVTHRRVRYPPICQYDSRLSRSSSTSVPSTFKHDHCGAQPCTKKQKQLWREVHVYQHLTGLFPAAPASLLINILSLKVTSMKLGANYDGAHVLVAAPTDDIKPAVRSPNQKVALPKTTRRTHSATQEHLGSSAPTMRFRCAEEDTGERRTGSPQYLAHSPALLSGRKTITTTRIGSRGSKKLGRRETPARAHPVPCLADIGLGGCRNGKR